MPTDPPTASDSDVAEVLHVASLKKAPVVALEVSETVRAVSATAAALPAASTLVTVSAKHEVVACAVALAVSVRRVGAGVVGAGVALVVGSVLALAPSAVSVPVGASESVTGSAEASEEVAVAVPAGAGDDVPEDFVLLLHAKGLSALRIQLRHVLRHALMPVVTILGLRIGWILGGAVTVEFVFARPGLGMLLIRGLNQHDYPVIQACLLMLSIAVMLGTLVGDLAQAAMDPRVRSALQ